MVEASHLLSLISPSRLMQQRQAYRVYTSIEWSICRARSECVDPRRSAPVQLFYFYRKIRTRHCYSKINSCTNVSYRERYLVWRTNWCANQISEDCTNSRTQVPDGMENMQWRFQYIPRILEARNCVHFQFISFSPSTPNAQNYVHLRGETGTFGIIMQPSRNNFGSFHGNDESPWAFLVRARVQPTKPAVAFHSSWHVVVLIFWRRLTSVATIITRPHPIYGPSYNIGFRRKCNWHSSARVNCPLCRVRSGKKPRMATRSWQGAQLRTAQFWKCASL